MRVLDKISLLDKIGRELQSRMSYSDIDVFLGAHGIDCKDFQPSTNSKWVYVKEVLADASEELVIRIANELDHNYSVASPKQANFWKTGHFKLFLSHLASFKAQTSRLQQALKKYAITSFVAHEDIEPSREWQIEIEAALHTMDALAAILMPGFKESNWCDQEVGFAVGREILIIPVRRQLDPYGFIGKYQGIQAANKSVAEVANEIFDTIIKSERTRNKMLRILSSAISQATDIDDAIEKVTILKSVDTLPVELLSNLSDQVRENSILVNSKKFLLKINALMCTYSLTTIIPGGEKIDIAWDTEIPF